MDRATHKKIVSFLWGIADDVFRDLFKRGKYPDVILPMCVLRRMDAVLKPTKKAVLDTKTMLDGAGITEQSAALAAAGQAFDNTSRFTLRDLKSRASRQQLLADYMNGFSQTFRISSRTSNSATSCPLLALRLHRLPHRQVPRTRKQPLPRARPRRRRHAPPPRPRQPLQGNRLRGAGPPLQRGQQSVSRG